MSKKITIDLNGNSLTLNFGVARFYNLFKEATGKDLLSYQNQEESTTTLIEITQGLVYAGYYADCKLNKATPLASKEEIFESVLDSEASWINDVFSRYIQSVSTNGVTSGEAVSQLISQ